MFCGCFQGGRANRAAILVILTDLLICTPFLTVHSIELRYRCTAQLPPAPSSSSSGQAKPPADCKQSPHRLRPRRNLPPPESSRRQSPLFLRARPPWPAFSPPRAQESTRQWSVVGGHCDGGEPHVSKAMRTPRVGNSSGMICPSPTILPLHSDSRADARTRE